MELNKSIFLQDQPFSIRKYQNTASPLFQIMCRFENFSAISFKTRPVTFPSETYGLIFTDNTQVMIASTSSSDTNSAVYIEGYTLSGKKVWERLLTDATNATTPVTSVNSYYAITQFSYANIPINWTGIVSLAKLGTSFTSGNPANAICAMISGSAFNNADITTITIPPNKTLVIHQLQFSKSLGSTVHRLDLCKTYTNADIFTQPTETIYYWSVTQNETNINYDGNFIIINKRANDDEIVYFRIFSTTAESTGAIIVRCSFSFI